MKAETTTVVDGTIIRAGQDIPDDKAHMVTNRAVLGKQKPVTPPGHEEPAAAVEEEAGGSSEPSLGEAGLKTIDEIASWVGEDLERAQAVIEFESAQEAPRPTLLTAMNDLISAADVAG